MSTAKSFLGLMASAVLVFAAVPLGGGCGDGCDLEIDTRSLPDGFVGVVTLVAYKQGAFEKRTTIYFHAPDAHGINKGMSVRLYGVPVGSVDELEIAEQGGVRVRLAIASDYIPRMPRGSQAKLTREGVVGGADAVLVVLDHDHRVADVA